MKKVFPGAVLAVFSLFMTGAVAVPVFAHHSVTAEFDTTHTVELNGVITKMDWFNPHIYVHLDAPDASGNVVHWNIEGGATPKWHRLGLNKDMMTPGTMLKIRVYEAKDGTKNLGFFREMTFQSGPNKGKHYSVEIGDQE